MVLIGNRDPDSELWRLPINPTGPALATNVVAKQNLQLLPSQRLNNLNYIMNNMHTILYLRNQVKFMHQTLFPPLLRALIKAINNNQLKGMPFMMTNLIRKHLTTLPATAKGRM